jgi:hypothetical protein
MNHDQATRYFDALGADLRIGRPSTAELITAGRGAQRRRTRKLVGLSAASVALVLGGTAVVQQAIAGDQSKPSGPTLTSDPTEAPTEAPTSEAPVAPPGQRLVGSGRLVVAVPESWGNDHECDGFVIAPPGECGAASRIEGMVRIFDLDSAEGQDVRLESPQSTTYNGVAVTEGYPYCPPTAACAAVYYVLVADENVGFQLAGPAAEGALKGSIVASLHLLPEGYTTMPLIQPGEDAPRAVGLLAGVGLLDRVRRVGFDGYEPDGFDPSGEYVRSLEPAAGSVVGPDEVVTMTVADSKKRAFMVVSGYAPNLGMTLTPSTAGPGDVVALSFPTERSRGLAFTLTRDFECRSSECSGSRPSGFVETYHLASDAAGDEPRWSDQPLQVRNIGVSGPGPDHVVVPSTAAAGDYRLCTTGRTPQLCVHLTVEN